MRTADCIPDESVYTVAEFNAYKKAMLTGGGAGVREIQFADKRTVFRSATEIRDLLVIMEQSIWGHCTQFRRRSVAVTSKGLC